MVHLCHLPDTRRPESSATLEAAPRYLRGRHQSAYTRNVFHQSHEPTGRYYLGVAWPQPTSTVRTEAALERVVRHGEHVVNLIYMGLVVQ